MRKLKVVLLGGALVLPATWALATTATNCTHYPSKAGPVHQCVNTNSPAKMDVSISPKYSGMQNDIKFQLATDMYGNDIVSEWQTVSPGMIKANLTHGDRKNVFIVHCVKTDKSGTFIADVDCTDYLKVKSSH